MFSQQTFPTWMDNWSKWLLSAAFILSGLYGLWEVIHYLLIDFPFNYYEAEVIGDAYRLSQGEYIFPEREVGPYGGLYAPGYHLILALLFQILPETLITGRIVSFLSILGIGWFILDSTGRRLSLRHYLITFVLLMMWHNGLQHFDLHAKPDSFGVFFAIGSLWAMIKSVQQPQSERNYLILSGILLALGFITKQTNLFMLAPIGGYLLLQRDWKNIGYFSLGFLGFSALSWPFIYWVTGPDMLFYLFQQPGTFRMRWNVLGDAIYNILDNPFVLIYLVVLAYHAYHQELRKPDILIFLALLFAYPASVLTAAKGGGLSNAYQPFYYLVTAGIIHFWMQKDSVLWESSLKTIRNFIFAFALLITTDINPPSMITTTEWRWQADDHYQYLTDRLDSIDGQIYAPFDNYLTLKADNPLIWSRKWEVETNMSGADHPPRNSRSISLHSKAVVTINHFGWNDEHRLEKLLSKNGFVADTTLPMDQMREYTLWVQPTSR